MTIQHTSRTGRTYYLHTKTTAAGNPSYFFSMDANGQPVPSIPDGYEVYENVGGQVFLRRKVAQAILPEELAVVEAALHQHGEPWLYRAEIRKDTIVILPRGSQETGGVAMR